MEKLYSAVLILMCVFTLQACGGNSGDDVTVTTLSNNELKNRAIENFGDNINDSVFSATSATSDAEDTLAGEQSVGEPITSGDNEGDTIDDDTLDLIASSMALGDVTGERTTRVGNRLTIDPDETQVCAEANEGDDTQAEIERCEILVRDMTVVVDADTDNSGTVTYSYLNQPVIAYAYSETTDSIEVQLEGLKALSDAEDELDMESLGETSSPDIVSGALSFSATTTNSTPGSEAGSVQLDVTRAVNVESGNQAALSIGTGTLFSISADEAEVSGRIELNVGEVILSSVEESDDDFSGNPNSETTIKRYDLKGLTAIIDSGLEDDALVVQNLSIGRGPFQLYVDDELVSQLSLDALGFRIDNEDGVITIDTNLNFRSFVDSAAGEGMANTNALQTILEVMAPSGSAFLDQDNGSLKVLQGGPLSYTLTETDGNQAPETTMVTVAAGQCFEDDAGLEEKPAIVDCD